MLGLRSLTPDHGLTSGLTLVEITGAGFPLDGQVEVLFGGAPASCLSVPSAERLLCVTPRHDAGAVDVEVHAGTEHATLARAFTYAPPDLAVETDLARLVRTLLRELKRQVHENVSLTTSTDFAEPGIERAELARLPALVLIGPALLEDRFYSRNDLPEQAVAPGVFREQREPYTVDLEFTLAGVTERTADLFNLLAAATLFFHKNLRIEVARDAADPAKGNVSYELALLNGLKVISTPNPSNVRHFTGVFVLRGFDLDEPQGIPLREGRIAEAVTVRTEAR
ncbi:MAG: IPT/TIG domain-containing protein [Deltaproteobacteria bacterium]